MVIMVIASDQGWQTIVVEDSQSLFLQAPNACAVGISQGLRRFSVLQHKLGGLRVMLVNPGHVFACEHFSGSSLTNAFDQLPPGF